MCSHHPVSGRHRFTSPTPLANRNAITWNTAGTAQWEWYDQKATFFKKRYLRIQVGVGIMSGIVPVLVAINSPNADIVDLLKLGAIALSLMVTVLTVWENVYKHGDNWRTYRGAAEDLAREKAMYDMKAGHYKRVKNPFMRFVERTEEIIGKQNGQWLSQMSQTTEEEKSAEGETRG